MKIKKILFVMASAAVMQLLAESEEVDGVVWQYVVEDGRAYVGNGEYNSAILSCTGGDVVVPKTLGGLDVVGLCPYAFYGCEDITSLTLPEGLAEIGFCACYCSSITNVNFPSTLMEISAEAFVCCENLKSIRLNEGLLAIGDNAFLNCGRLESLSIPSTVVKIGCDAFAGTAFLRNQDNGWGMKDGWALSWIGDQPPGSIDIPSGVHSIADGALAGFDVENVLLPTTLRHLGNFVFRGCSKLTKITMPDGLVTLGVAAFQGCSSLSEVTIPPGVKSIGISAFSGCASLLSVTIPNGVTNVGEYAFEECCSLGAVTIPDSVRSIGYGAFKGCGSLAAVVIPDDVERIEGETFSGCGMLKAVTMPEGLTTLGGGAFRGCCSLTSVTIPPTVSAVGSGAFRNCSEIKDVYLQGDVTPQFGTFAFDGCNPDLVLHVPSTWSGRNRVVDGHWVEIEGGGGGDRTVNLVVTNVVVQYVLNSVQPQFAIPAASDTGFVNVITEVKGGAVAIPSSWAGNYPAFESKFGSDFTKAISMKTGKRDGAGNDMFVWQDYVAGTDPTNPKDKFRASITVVEGKVMVSHTPELDDARKALRKYTTWGKGSLLDVVWTEVPEGREADYNFFKVTVEMR